MQLGYKYADLLDDDVFKLVFGQESSKDVTIEFLNQVITDRNIVDLAYNQLEGLGSPFPILQVFACMYFLAVHILYDQ